MLLDKNGAIGTIISRPGFIKTVMNQTKATRILL